jgi:hypothetical protein
MKEKNAKQKERKWWNKWNVSVTIGNFLIFNGRVFD